MIMHNKMDHSKTASPMFSHKSKELDAFMIVGHTHDDIDALFGRWNMLLKKEKFPTILALIKLFMNMESILTILHVIEEVPNCKSFIDRMILDRGDIFVPHTRQQVKFYLDATRCPKMKYKLYCTDVD